MKIDVRRVIEAKNARLANCLPKFVINWLRRIIHEQELNLFFEEAGDAKGIDFANKAIERLKVTYTIEVAEGALKEDGRYIFVSNHPLGGLDGLILISTIGKRYKNLKFLVNDFLMHVKAMDNIFVPVNKVGGMSRSYSQGIEEMYASQNQLLYFPAGICSRRINGEITDLEWQLSFYKKALRSGREIVPVHFSGRNSNFFYRLANIRKFLGIKFNIEMLFLPDEMIKATGSHYTIKIGKPIAPKEYRNKAELKSLAEEIRRISHNL